MDRFVTEVCIILDNSLKMFCIEQDLDLKMCFCFTFHRICKAMCNYRNEKLNTVIIMLIV